MISHLFNRKEYHESNSVNDVLMGQWKEGHVQISPIVKPSRWCILAGDKDVQCSAVIKQASSSIRRLGSLDIADGGHRDK